MKNLQRNSTQRHSLYKSQRGVSLLIAMGLVTVIVLFGLIVSNVVVTSIRQSANVNRANEAYFAAEGGLEQGLLENMKQGAGYTGDLPPIDYDGGVSAAVSVQGQVPVDIKYLAGDYAGKYGTPTPGTGNVGEDCNPLEPHLKGVFTTDTGAQEDEPANHPCNWNKLTTGETASIPLYYEDTNGAYNLVTNNNDEIIIRVRAACVDGNKSCLNTLSSTDRYSFDYLTKGDPEYQYDDPLLTWQIQAVDTSSKQSKVLAGFPVFNPNFNGIPSTLLAEKKLNNWTNSSYKNEVLYFAAHRGEDLDECQDTIINFLLGASSTCSHWSAIEKPMLKISVIKSLISDQDSPVPYLEYQVISTFSTTQPPTDTSQTITAEGFSGEFKQILEVKQPQEGGLLEYVIQQ